MEEFLRLNYSNITHGVEFLAALVGILMYKKFKMTTVKYFIFFLIYVFILELIGSYTRFVDEYESLSFVKEWLKGTKFEKNRWWYTLGWSIGSALFFSFYFQKIIKNKTSKLVLKYIRITFFMFAFIYIGLNWELFFTHPLTSISILGSLVILISVSLYFVEILKSNQILNFHHSVSFYIATVLFIWVLIITPLAFYEVYFSKSDWNFVFLKWQIYLYANIIMYLTFSIALICCKPVKD